MGSTPDVCRPPDALASFDPEREELDAVLSSGAFDRNSNLGRLLLYICQKRFEGESSQVKEFNIAVDVFARSMDFDKKRDSIVRVEASRLRKRLKDYYEDEGRGHAIQIVVPLGQYVPRFVPSGQAAPHETGEGTEWQDTEPIREAAPRRARRAAILLGACALVAFVLWISAAKRTRPASSVEAGEPITAASAAGQPVAGAAAVPFAGDEVRILCGYQKERYTDRLGQVWYGDRYFEGGIADDAQRGFLGRTLDPTMFQTMRTGGDFYYDIPLKPGVYELRLYFAETEHGPGQIGGGGEGSRQMSILMNGQPLLRGFDVLANAGGPRIAHVRVFKDVRPAPDGYLRLAFNTISGFPFVNAVEIVPGIPGKLRPIRIAARETTYTDQAGRTWQPDSFFLGGRIATRRDLPNQMPDRGLYTSERYGNFSYAIPVAANGRYAVTLRFAETWFCGQDCGGGEGERIFNVYSNGTALLRNFDIHKAAGGPYRPADRTFRGLVPNAQGNLLLQFEPVKNYAVVNAIEVIDESN